MENVKKIAKRINKRKMKSSIQGEIFELEQNKKGQRIYKWFMFLLGVYAIFVSFAIYVKKDESATTLNSLFKTDMNFSSFNKAMGKVINFRIVEQSVSSSNEQTVSSTINYINMGNDYYTSDDHLLVALDDGVVTYVNGKDENYTVIVEFDKGYRATFTDISEVNVYVNDRVYKDDILGSFNDEIKILFIRDKNKLTYEEVLALD